MEKWRVFVALNKAQFAISLKKASQLSQKRELRYKRKIFAKLVTNVNLKQDERMGDHMVSLFQTQVKPLLYKSRVFESLKLFKKYVRATDRLDHMKVKKSLRVLYQNMLKAKQVRLNQQINVKQAKQFMLAKIFNSFK